MCQGSADRRMKADLGLGPMDQSPAGTQKTNQPVLLIRVHHMPTTGTTGASGHRDTGTQGHRDTGTQGHRDTGTQGHRDTGTQGRRDTGTQGQGQQPASAWEEATRTVDTCRAAC